MTKQGGTRKSAKTARKTVASPMRSPGAGAKSVRVKAPVPAPAKVKATTIRLNPELQMGLELLQGVLHKPVNKMVNEAVAIFVSRRKAKVEADLEGVLAKLKAYKRRDPDFEQAIQQFAEAEASLGRDDPIEGTASRAESGKLGPTQKAVRQLLDG